LYSVALLAGGILAPLGAQPWTFGIYADIHTSADRQVLIEDSVVGLNANGERAYPLFQKHQCEFVLFPGDMHQAHYLKEKVFKDKFPQMSDSLLIQHGSKLAYDNFKMHCTRFGFAPILCVGDHELNDDSWRLNTPICKALPVFKDAFRLAAMFDSSGKELYTDSIGGVPQRPLGTPYAGTSYAFIRGNIMFVTVDTYRYEGPDVIVGDMTTSHQCGTGAVVGAHLDWLDKVLAAGRKAPGVDFVIVQAHLPILRPVRSYMSSLMLIDDYERSTLWQTMVANGVDIYLGGEIHMPTTSRQKGTSLIQIISGSQSSFLVGTVEDKRLRLEMYDSTASVCGTMELRTDKGERSVVGTGLLSPIDVEGLAVHYSFDSLQKTDTLELFANSGQLGPFYVGEASGVVLEPGVLGMAGRFGGPKPTYVLSREWNPVNGDMGRSVSAWIKSSAPEAQTISLLVNLPHMQYAFGIDAGVLSLRDSVTVLLKADHAPITDGRWHHVAVVNQGGVGAKLEDARFYVDGVPVKTAANSVDRLLSTNKWGRMGVGTQMSGDTRSVGDFVDAFNGAIDDFAVWSAPLSAAMIKAVHTAARHPKLGYNAAVMDSLFYLHRNGGNSVVAGRQWEAASGLKGSVGSVNVDKKGAVVVVLTERGEGVRTVRK
jgi:hypothetical protein